MPTLPSVTDFSEISKGYDKNPSRSLSLAAEAYTGDPWFNVDQLEIIGKSWQWVCHVEKVREPGSYTCVDIASRPVAVVRDLSLIHISEPTRQEAISYAVFCLKKKK